MPCCAANAASNDPQLRGHSMRRRRDAGKHPRTQGLQPIGSYKLRGACNNMKVLLEAEGAAGLQQRGVTTCSSGNWACGIAFMCAQLGVPCAVGCVLRTCNLLSAVCFPRVHTLKCTLNQAMS